MIQRFLILFAILVLPFQLAAQGRYWVFFADKSGSTITVDEFHPNALERRQMIGIQGYDSTDYPVSQRYVQEIGKYVSEVVGQSRWFNGVVVEANSKQLKKIRGFSYVKSIEAVQGYFYASKAKYEDSSSSQIDLATRQVARFNGNLFKKHEVDGKGIRIAVFDAGFPGVDTHIAFEHIRKEERIVATYDFTKNSTNVYHANDHGTKVLSCIAGIYKGQPMGMATGAEFLLAITEVGREPFSEELNWLAALEWADRNGAHIVNSSLGYTFHRYFPEQMDGKTSFVSRAAAMAAQKGILVINAAGNEGSSKWKVIGAPADAEFIISVGGISPQTQLHIDFASHGPTADGRLKPNVTAFGEALVANGHGGFGIASGTSFASPLVAGFAACAWQLKPNATAFDMLGFMEQSADLYPYFDYAHGYGVPQANFFVDSIQSSLSNDFITFERAEKGVRVLLSHFNPSTMAGYNTTHLFWHIRRPDGTLVEYGVVRVYQSKAFFYPTGSIELKGHSLWINCLGHTACYNF